MVPTASVQLEYDERRGPWPLAHSNDRADGKSLTGNGPLHVTSTNAGRHPALLTSLPHQARYRDAIENLAHKNMSLGDGEVVASDLFVDPED